MTVPSGPGPGEAGAARPAQAVLFACALNAVRSPMAEAIARHYFGSSVYIRSAGVRTGELDPFAVAVLDEIGIDLTGHKPQSFADLEEWEGLNFDLIVTLSPEAHHKALDLTRTLAADVVYWPTADPTDAQGSREQKLDAYRQVRDGLTARIKGLLTR